MLFMENTISHRIITGICLIAKTLQEGRGEGF